MVGIILTLKILAMDEAKNELLLDVMPYIPTNALSFKNLYYTNF